MGMAADSVVRSLSDRLKSSRKDKGWSQAELARRAGCSQQCIGDLERGRNHKSKHLGSLARTLSVDPHWLETGREPRLPVRNLRPAPDQRVPLVSLDQAVSTLQGYPPADVPKVGCPVMLSDKGICVTMVGDAMAPAFGDGDVLFLEPLREPGIGDYVLMQFGAERHPVVRQLSRDGDRWLACCSAPGWPDPVRPFQRLPNEPQYFDTLDSYARQQRQAGVCPPAIVLAKVVFHGTMR